MHTHRMYLEGHHLAYRDEGTGEPMVLVHGTPSSSLEFAEVITLLGDRFRCVAPDHLGFGASDKPANGDYRLAAHRHRLATLLGRLGIERFHLVVHDFGGAIALPLVIDRPERALSVTCVNTWLWPLEETDPSLSRQRWLMTSSFMRALYLHANLSARMLVPLAWGRHRPLTRDVRARYASAFPTADSRHGTVAFLRALFDTSDPTWRAHERLGDLGSVPMQLIWGGRDVIDQATLERWRALCPRASVDVLPDVGHFVADEAPKLLAPILRRCASVVDSAP
jgi:pimeloyl-ACP methyl ester carboxylesterase